MQYKEYETDEELLNDILFDDHEAVEFCLLVGRVCQFTDDVRDQDKPLDGRTVELETFVSWFSLDNSAFYIRYRNELQPIFKAAYLAWVVANEFERSGDERLQRIAYVMREFNVSLSVHCAMILGGVEYAMKIAPTVWWNCFKDETFEEYADVFSRRKESTLG